LKHKIINWGYWIRSQHTEEQFIEVANRYDLWATFAPFSHCLACSGNIIPAKKEEIVSNNPPKAAIYFQDFFQCNQCQRIYWKGSHYKRMLQTLNRLCKIKQPKIALFNNHRIPDFYFVLKYQASI
jgi:uncharacterized protein with PIN domain